MTDLGKLTRDRWIADRIMEISPWRVLDAGCGTMPYLPVFKNINHCCVYEAQDVERRGPEPLEYQCDITKIPCPSKRYDLVLCTEVLEHVPDPVLALQELVRVCRIGGKILLTAPQGSRVHMAPHHYYGGFSGYWYAHWLPKLGCKIIEVSPCLNHAVFIHQEINHLAYALRRRGLPWWPLAGFLRLIVSPMLRLAGVGHRDVSLPIGFMVVAERIS